MTVCGSEARIQLTARSISPLEITEQEQMIIREIPPDSRGKATPAH